MNHELLLLAKLIDWQGFNQHCGEHFSKNRRPSIPSRMMIGLQILKQIHAFSDKVVCKRWVENPYFQYFCRETFFHHKFPIERSSMTHWRKRAGKDALIALLQ